MAMAVMGGLTPLNERTPLMVNIIMTYDDIMSNAPLIPVFLPSAAAVPGAVW